MSQYEFRVALFLIFVDLFLVSLVIIERDSQIVSLKREIDRLTVECID